MSRDHLRDAIFLLGFATIVSQGVLLREILSSFQGNDLTVAAVLASWMLLTAVGARLRAALAGGARPPAGDAGRPRWPPVAIGMYVVVVLGHVLAVRLWGRRDVVTFTDHLWVPLFLAAPCLLAGALFPAFVHRLSRGTGDDRRRAYAWETLGGLSGGLLAGSYILAGGGGVPGVAMLLVPCGALTVLPVGLTGARRTALLGAIATGALALGLLPPGHELERRSQQIRYPSGKVIAHRATPHGSYTALSVDGRVYRFRDGVPAANGEVTPSREILALQLALLPRAWRRVVCVNAASSGMAASLSRWHGAEAIITEMDPTGAVLGMCLGSAEAAEAAPTAVADYPLPAGEGRIDLVAVFAAPPVTLDDNRLLTADFFGRAAERLGPEGVLALVLPSSPGFARPAYATYLDSVERALATAFGHTMRVDEQSGRVLFAGSRGTISVGTTDVGLARVEGVTPADVLWARRELLPSEDVAADLFGTAEPAPAAEPTGANRVRSPVAYYWYQRFREGALQQAPPQWTRVLRPQQLWLGALCMAGLWGAVQALARRHGSPAAGGLFWCSWLGTATLTLSSYLVQTMAGQICWIAPVLVAMTMAGIFLGTTARTRRTWAAPLPIILLTLLFPAYPVLQRLPLWLVLAGLGIMNLLAGHLTGTRVAAVSAGLGPTERDTSRLVFWDLLGATGGFVLGAVILPWWHGFQVAAILSAAACGARLARGRDVGSKTAPWEL